MEKDKALEIWDAVFGKDRKWVQDCFGTYIYREDYGDTETERIRPGNSKKYNYGWEIDHIRPKSDFGENANPDLLNNYEPMHYLNNRRKADNYPTFTIGEHSYEVVVCDICKRNGLKGYGITDKNGKRIDWKGKQKKYFTSNK